MASALDDFLSSIPIDQLAAQLGVSEDEATKALHEAAPALLAGMQANAADPAGAASLERALGDHSGSLLDSFDLGALDIDDGAKIVRNIFGDQEDQVVNQLSGAQGLSSGTLMKLLPMLAPLVMSYLSKMMSGKGASAAPPANDRGSSSSPGTGFPGPSSASGSSSSASDDGGGGGLGDILGGGGLGDVLGGLLGGGGGGGLGDLLGGLLGGGKR